MNDIDLRSQGPVVQATRRDIILDAPVGSFASGDRLWLPLRTAFQSAAFTVLKGTDFVLAPALGTITARLEPAETGMWFLHENIAEDEAKRSIYGVLVHEAADGTPRPWSGLNRVIFDFLVTEARGYA